MRICHITPHLGGGVKTVLLNWAKNDASNTHSFFCLNYADDHTKLKCIKDNIDVCDMIYYNSSILLSKINTYDIVVLHYWNFPLIHAFFIQNKLPPCRLVVWNHSSCLYAPYNIYKKLFDVSDRVVFTSSISEPLYSPSLKIWSTGDMTKFKNIKFKNHKGFNILYIGTLDYSKIHYNYIDVCKVIVDNIKDAKFIMCGSGDSEQDIKDRAMKYGIYDKFTFTGIVDNVEDYVSMSDVFLYILSPTQFGTCEQILGETMASGLIPIVLNNTCESNIVKNNYNGKVVYCLEDCIMSIMDIYNKKDIEYLSQNAKKVSNLLYDTNHMINSWNAVFNDVVKFTKKERFIDCEYKYSLGMNSFLESMDKYRSVFIDYLCTGNDSKLIKLFKSNYYQWKSTSKGSIKQYLSFFKDDVFLIRLNKVLESLDV